MCILKNETKTKKRLQSCKDGGNRRLERKENDCCEGTSNVNFMLLFRLEPDHIRLMHLKTLGFDLVFPGYGDYFFKHQVRIYQESPGKICWNWNFLIPL